MPAQRLPRQRSPGRWTARHASQKRSSQQRNRKHAERAAISPVWTLEPEERSRRDLLRHEVVETAGTLAGGLLALLNRTGGIPPDLWRDPYALGFIYCVIGGLSLHAGIEGADLPEVMSAAFGAVLDQTRHRLTETAGSETAKSETAKRTAENAEAIDINDPTPKDSIQGHDGLNRLAAAIALLSQEDSDFTAGLDAGDKIIAVTLGYADYDDDPAVIEARRDAAALSDSSSDTPSDRPADTSPEGPGAENLAAAELDSFAAAQLSRDEATILCLQQRLFCVELRRRLAPAAWLH